MSNGILRNVTTQTTLFTDVAAAIVSDVVDTTGYRTAVVQIIATDSPTATVKIIGSNENGVTTFSANGTTPDASAKTKIWNYVKLVDLDAGSTAAGSTGLAWTGTAKSYTFEVNTNLIAFMAVEISGYSAGKVTAKIRMCDNK